MTLSFIFYFCYYILTSLASKVFALFISVESVWLFCHMHTKTLTGNKVNWVRSLFCFFLQIRTLLTEIDYTLVSRHGCRLASASHSPPPSFLLFFFSFSKPSTLFPSPFLIYPPVGIALQWVGRAFQKVLSSWLILRIGAKSKIHGSLLPSSSCSSVKAKLSIGGVEGGGVMMKFFWNTRIASARHICSLFLACRFSKKEAENVAASVQYHIGCSAGLEGCKGLLSV